MMKKLSQFNGKKVVVLGLAKSGYHAALLLHELGAKVIVNDGKTPDDLTDVNKLKSLGVEVITGFHPTDLIDDSVYYVVKNPGIPYENSIVVQAKQCCIPIITDVELAYLISQAPIIGITGSNGKTTTTTLIYEMLQHSEMADDVVLAGNIGIPATHVAKNVQTDDVIVMELSSFQLMGIEQFRPKIAVLTNIYEAHLDYHHTREEYISAKLNIFKNQTEDDFAILNADLAESQIFALSTKARVLYFSRLSKQADAYVDNGKIYVYGEYIASVSDVQLAGTHNLENILAAALVAKTYGQSNERIVRVIQTFKGVAHRCEFVRTVNNRSFYNDSKATNILATQMALKGFEKPVVLIAGGLDRGNGFETLEPSLTNVKHMVVYGQTRDKLAQSANRVGVAVSVVETLDEAVDKAYQQSQNDDVILFSPACASWDQFENFEKRGECFVERVLSLK